MPSTFHEQEVASRLKQKRKLSSFIDALIGEHLPHIKKAQLTYIFCSDEALLGINQQFLDHDTLTDIITFDLSENKDTLTGEIYISIERVAENAQVFKTTYDRELHRVIFHGALHLCGFKDKTKKDAEKMRAGEDACLEAWYLQ